ncbi:unnamed protein product, partial [Rotaria magnacalcarata]
YRASSFYGFSFIELSGSSEDSWSVHSSNTVSVVNTNIRDEIKTCIETLNTCLNQFRGMNGQLNNNDVQDEIDEDVTIVLNELIDQIENVSDKSESQCSNDLSTVDSISLDYNLLNELFTKKLTFNEYLNLLDHLIDNKILNFSSKSGEELSNDILHLADEIEHYKTMIKTDNNNEIDQNFLSINLDNQYHQQWLSNTQSNYSVISFLQQSTSMDMSLLVTNDFSSQIQSTLITSTVQQQTTTPAGKRADVERSSKRSRILDFFRGRGRPAMPTDKNSNDHQPSYISFIDKTSLKFINIRDNIVTQPINEWDDPKTRNIAYCAVIYNEFLKELAAITLEHSVQQFDDDQIFDDILPISLTL